MNLFKNITGRSNFLPYSLTIVCPDTNFTLKHLHPYEEGIGGGKTAILLFTYTARKYFKNVEFIGNVIEGRFDNITYKHINNVNNIDTDILLVTTSSDLDFSSLLKFKISAKLKLAWIHNYLYIKYFENFDWDLIIACSYFIKTKFVNDYGYNNVYTIHNGTPWSNNNKLKRKFLYRDPYSIIFASSPTKGLQGIIQLIPILRNKLEKPFTLHIYGGYGLWGLKKEIDIKYDFVKFHGLKNLHELTYDLHKYSFMIGIYDFEEPFGMIYTQALKAGIINILSNVGAINEYIKHGFNGFLINETKMNDNAISEVINILSLLIKNKDYQNYIRKNAKKYNRSWDNVLEEFCDIVKAKLKT